MPLSHIRLREDDLAHVNDAVSRCAEQILASTRQAAGCASRYPWGILIEQSGSARRWPQCPGQVEYLHLLDQTELVPDLGVYALANRKIDNVPASQYIGVCPWFHRAAAAQFLWTECLTFCRCDRHFIETYLALKLKERPSNDQRPGFSETRHGTFLHLDASLSQAFQSYFVLEAITAPTQPTTIRLGAETYLVFARSNDPREPFRAMIVGYEWNVHMAIKELQRWLKQKQKSKEISIA